SAQQTPEPEKSPKPSAATPPAGPPVLTCPQLDLKTATQPVREGVPVKFTATLVGADPKIPVAYDWYLSAGVINRGQGTPVIDVNTAGAGPNREIVANLLVGGFPPECVMTASTSVPVAGPAQKVDEFGEVKDEEETARLDRFASYIAPTDIGYVFGYGGRQSVRGFANENLRKMRTYLLKSGVSSSNLVFVDGGYRDVATFELWLVPRGAEAPRATPTVSSKDIVFPKRTPVKRKP
ncbi:MAG: hypothetical protein ABIV48_04430, partial [Pyrinomonadaceae bacterium]